MKKVIFLLLAVIVSFYLLQAQEYVQVGQDIDGVAEYDYSGHSVSISADGSIMAIGAYGNSESTGSVRVFQDVMGTWTQIGENIEGVSVGVWLGWAVSLSDDGSVLAIGSPYNEEMFGTVSVFQNEEGTWTQIGQDIVGDDHFNQSGWSVSLSGDGSVLAIGAPSFGNDLSGNVRVFRNEGGIWTQMGQNIYGEAINDRSGWSISLSSNGMVVAIGAPYNEGILGGSGHVRVYQYNSELWSQIGLDIDGEMPDGRSGTSVSINSDGSIVAVGTPFTPEIGAGFVNLYQNQSETWTFIGALQPEVGEGARFGISVSLSSDGSIVAVGAEETNNNTGRAFIYQNQEGVWTQIGQNIDGEAISDLSGHSVSLSSDGMIVAIGAAENDGNGVDSGHVRAYELFTSNICNPAINNLSIYPNPTNEKIYLELEQSNIKSLSLFDITGKILIHRTDVQQKEVVDISGYENGIYIICIQTENELLQTKIVKK